MPKKKSRFVKVFIYLALAAICITVISPFVMYFGAEFLDSNNCEEWYVRDEESQECVEDTADSENNEDLNDEESCTAAWKTWYAENGVCI